MKRFGLTCVVLLVGAACLAQAEVRREKLILRGETYELFTEEELIERGFEVKRIRRLDNAATYYIDAINRYVEMPDEGRLHEQYMAVQDKGWTEDFPELAAWLAKNGKTIRLVEEGASKKQYAFPVIYSRMVAGILLPHLGQYRNLARLLVIDAHRQARLGRYGEAAARLDTLCHAIGHWREEPFLIGGLVAIACVQMAAEHAVMILQHHPLGEKPIERLAAAVDHLHAHRPDYAHAMRSESIFGRRTVTELMDVDIDLRALGVRMPPGLFPLKVLRSIGGSRAVRIALPDRTVKKHMEGFYDKALAAAKLPAWQVAGENLDRLGRQWLADIPAWDILSRMLLPAVSRVRGAYARCDTRIDLLRVVVALHLYHAENGTFPVQLKQLVPDYLDAVPADRYSEKGEPLHYKNHAGKGYTVYSIGPDLVDQGGIAGKTDDTGDMVYSYTAKEDKR